MSWATLLVVVVVVIVVVVVVGSFSISGGDGDGGGDGGSGATVVVAIAAAAAAAAAVVGPAGGGGGGGGGCGSCASSSRSSSSSSGVDNSSWFDSLHCTVQLESLPCPLLVWGLVVHPQIQNSPSKQGFPLQAGGNLAHYQHLQSQLQQQVELDQRGTLETLLGQCDGSKEQAGTKHNKCYTRNMT